MRGSKPRAGTEGEGVMRESHKKSRSTNGGGEGGDVGIFSPFGEGTARKYPFPSTYLTNLLMKGDRFELSLPTM